MKIVFLLLFQMIYFVSRGQAFEKGQLNITAGYGYSTNNALLGYSIADLLLDQPSGFQSFNDVLYGGVGPVFGKIEYGYMRRIGIGINISYININPVDIKRIQPYPIKTFNSYSVLLRGNYHMSGNKKVDLYAGLGIGYRKAWITYHPGASNKWSEQDSLLYCLPFGVPLGMELTFGGRFYIVPNKISIYFELGLAKAIFQIGLTGKISFLSSKYKSDRNKEQSID